MRLSCLFDRRRIGCGLTDSYAAEKSEHLFSWSERAEAAGTDTTDGVVTLATSIAIGIGALCIGTSYGRWISMGALLCGGIVTAIAAYNIGHYYDLRSNGDLGASLVSLQMGIFITATGGVVAAVGGLAGLLSRK
jgi:hypothetical protein